MEMTVKEAAQLFNVPEDTIFTWIEKRAMPAEHVDGLIRLNRDQMLEWAGNTGVKVTPEFLNASSLRNSPLPMLTDALQTGGIFYGVEGGDRESALKAVVQSLKLPESIDRTFLFQVLLAREEQCSTGIGGGIAIPHTRNPIVLSVDKPLVVLSFLKRPVDFGSVDGQPVNILFTMITPTVRIHLNLLSKLVYLLQNASFKDLLRRQSRASDIIQCVKETELSLKCSS
jgi:nitrogen PTS system EIIA component